MGRKNTIIRFVIIFVVLLGISIGIDAISGSLKHSIGGYLLRYFILLVILGAMYYLDKAGWNSWKKVGELFKKKQ